MSDFSELDSQAKQSIVNGKKSNQKLLSHNGSKLEAAGPSKGSAVVALEDQTTMNAMPGQLLAPAECSLLPKPFSTHIDPENRPSTSCGYPSPSPPSNTLSAPQRPITRTASFQLQLLPTMSYENDPCAPISPTKRLTNRSSQSSLRSIAFTPTTECLARRMAHPHDCSTHTHHASRDSISSHTSSSNCSGSPNSTSFPLSSSQEIGGSPSSPRKSPKSRVVSDATVVAFARASNSSTSTLSEDLISYLPKIPATAARTTEEERLAKWGPNVGPPNGGSTNMNPHNYEVIEAYFETEDDPLFMVTDSTRRAGNAAIQTMFDQLYPLPGLDGMIPRGFPVFGFSMREMPTSRLLDVIEAYGLEPIEGTGYAVDRQNMSLLCSHIGATWLAGVI